MVSLDRTGDFARIVEDVRAKRLAAKKPVPTPRAAARPAHSKFHTVAGDVARELVRTYDTLDRLTKLAKSTSMYGDPAADIENLSDDVKQSLAQMRDQLTLLQDLQESQNEQVSTHSQTVVKSLSARLQRAKTAFLNVLETRKENLKNQYEKKKQLFGSPSSAMVKKNASSPLYALPAPSSSSASTSSGLLVDLPESESNASTSQGDVAITIPQHMLVQRDQQIETRASALAQVQQTIEELSHIFERVSLLVAQQGEMIARIEDDTEQAETRLLSTREQLERAWQSVASSRWLYAKMGAVALLFLIIFLVFFV